MFMSNMFLYIFNSYCENKACIHEEDCGLIFIRQSYKSIQEKMNSEIVYKCSLVENHDLCDFKHIFILKT